MIEKFLIGTYTHRVSKGIYELSLDDEAKKLTSLDFVGEAGSPTYLALSKANKLYAVDKVTENGETKGGLKAFDRDNDNQAIQSILDSPTSPAYVTVDEDRQLVYAANYHAATVSVYKINQDGTLTGTDRVTDEGQVGPQPEGPHPHYADLTPDNRLVVADLGLDLVYLYDVSADGKLSEVSRLEMPAGFGPRHIQFDDQHHTAYLVGELSSNLAVLDYDADAGKLSIRDIHSTKPADWTEHNGAAAIRLTADHRSVYVSNRGHNSLAVFALDDKGSAERIQLISTEGDFPRDFNLNADESLVIVVNQNTDNASLYSRDADSGKLTLVQKDFDVPEGVCVLAE